MSASMVRKSLEIVDIDFSVHKGKKNREKKDTRKSVSETITTKNSRKKGSSQGKLSKPKKSTLAEARKTRKLKEETLKRNLDKLKLIKEACRIELDPIITKQLFKRAVTKEAVGGKRKKKEFMKTAFTEKDFAAFKDSYVE